MPAGEMCIRDSLYAEGLVLDILERIPEGDGQALYFHPELTVNGEKMSRFSGCLLYTSPADSGLRRGHPQRGRGHGPSL